MEGPCVCIWGWGLKDQESHVTARTGHHSTQGSPPPVLSGYNLAELFFRHEEGAVGRGK